MTTPPLRPGRVPTFHELGEDAFEDLCREIVQEEDGVATAERYGTRGQRQFGADLLIDCADGSLWVGQCKSHKECDEKLIRRACDDFLEHADRWSAKNVTKFILFLAADTRRRQLHDQRLRQRERLLSYGFSFTVWSAAVLKAKLRRHPRIVQHFLPYHVDFICGPSAIMEVVPGAHPTALLALASQYGERVGGEHVELLRLWREGYPTEALSRLRKLKEELSSVAAISPPTLTKLLHLEGRLLVAIGDVPGAKRLLPATATSDASGRARLVAMIAQADGRLDDAITVLGEDADSDNQALKAVLHLQRGDEAVAGKILSRLHDHPEASRLRAIVSLVHGDVPNARVEAERALQMAPTWYWMRRTAATIRYIAGLSPVVAPRGLPEWPQPIPPSLVRQDNESVEARRAAAEEFRRLSDPKFQQSTDEHACIDAWRVACLVDDPGLCERAIDVASSSLANAPENYRVMVWVLARELPVSTAAATSLLETKVQRMDATLEEAIALMAGYATKGDLAAARAVLEQTASLSNDPSQKAVADSWRTQIQKIADASSNSLDGTARAEQALARLRTADASTNHVARWEQYMTLAQLGHWAEIAAAAADLIPVFRTSDAARLACHALYNVNDIDGCLNMLGQAKSVFLNGELSLDLRRLQVMAQRDAGAIPEAIRVAREVFEESKAADAFMELARLYYQMGDLKSVAITARQYQSVTDLAAQDYLTLSSWLKVEDTPLALTLWKAAVTAGVQDQHVGLAFELGSNLAADEHLDVLAQRLTALGHKKAGGIEAVELDEVVKRMAERRRQLSEVSTMMREGSLPIHLAAHVTGTPLATVLRRFRLFNKMNEDRRHVSPVYLRFGGRTRGCLAAEGTKQPRLIADVTAILNAAYFGVLGLVEKTFGIIHIPQATVVALAAMQDALRPNQPDRTEAKRKLCNLVSAGVVKTFSLGAVPERQAADGDLADDVLCLLRYASSRNALLVDFLPPRAADPRREAAIVPSEYRRLSRDAHSVVDALLGSGTLSRHQHATVAKMLGPRSSRPVETAIVEGAELVCRSEIAVLLGTAGVLDLVTDRFRIAISVADAESERLEVEEARKREADATWVGGIIDRIRQGLESKIYQFLPKVPDESSGRDVREPGELETVLRDLLTFPGDEADVLWIDDRCLNSYAHSEGKQIVDTIDVLVYLKDRRQLSEQELHRFFGEMRATDSRFIAFSAEELLAALREAPVNDGVVAETEQLRVLREYYARCLLEADSLRPPMEGRPLPDASTEWHFLLNCGRAVLVAMVRIWESGTEDEKTARAEWLLRNMYTDDRGLHGTGTRRGPGFEEYQTAMAISGLVGMALELDRGDSDRRVRRSYFEWLYRRVICHRFAVDKNVAVAAIEQVKGLLTSDSARRDTEEGRLARALMGRLWTDLPQEVRELTDADQGFLETLGVSTRTVVSIGPVQVESRELWDALELVLNDGNPVEAKSIEGESVRLSLVSVDPIVFSAQCTSAGLDAELKRDDFVFLWRSVSDREAGAERLEYWFDLPPDRREEMISTAVAGQDAGSRMETAIEARAASGAVFYHELAAGVRDGGVFRRSETIPTDPRVLVAHLRVAESGPLSDGWQVAIARLVEQVGVVEAAVRICGLPVRLPDTFVEAVRGMSSSEQETTLQRLRRTWAASPVGIVHIADLWSRAGISTRRSDRVCGRVVRVLCSERFRGVFDAWRAVLWWVHEQFGCDERMGEMPPEVRLGLVWAHADRVFRIFRGRGLSSDWIAGAFGESQHLVAPEVVFPENFYGDDIAAPLLVTAELVTVGGLAYVAAERENAVSIQKAFGDTLMAMDEEGRARVLTTMMMDGSNAGNILGSWLAYRDKVLTFVPEGSRESFSLDAVTRVVLESRRAIQSGSDVQNAWTRLIIAVGNRPPSGQVLDALTECFDVADLVELVEANPSLGTMVVNAIGVHGGRLSESCRTSLLDKLVALARWVSEWDSDTNERQEVALAMLGAVMRCTWSKSDGRGSAFAGALEAVADACPRGVLNPAGASIVLRMCEALPVQQARHFWRLRNILRARSPL